MARVVHSLTEHYDMPNSNTQAATEPFRLYRLGVARDEERAIILTYFKELKTSIEDWLDLDFDV